MHQTEIVNLEDLVPMKHIYRRFAGIWNFKDVEKQLFTIETDNNYKIYGLVDATHLISKASLWKERDKVIQDKYKKLNNEILPLIARDTQAKIGQNKDKDCWYSNIRIPYEKAVAKQNKRVRYVGIAKNQFAVFMHAICFNLKHLLALTKNFRLQHSQYI